MAVDFLVVAPSEVAAAAIAEAGRRLGYASSWSQDDAGAIDSIWTTICTREMLLSYASVLAAQAELDALARPHHGYIDGWGTFGNVQLAPRVRRRGWGDVPRSAYRVRSRLCYADEMSSDIPAPIAESISIVANHRALFGSGPAWSVVKRQTDIQKVIEVFRDQGAAWVLIGAHAVGLVTQPRATADFDFIVESSALPRVLTALGQTFGELGARDVGGAIELSAIDVDLVQSSNHPLFQEAIDQARTEGAWRLPRPEVLIALKFLASISPWRSRTRRAQDAVDLRAVYLKVGAANLDLPEMQRLAGLAYPEAEREFSRLIAAIDRGDPITI